ncbi:Eukaryotic LigT isoform 1 [Hibiscus syriacus]|uniref:Eukaryotic LigT isoform 1 n=1 Tax=Hibiscus syriacus TaxID=106335 RepID=A0A6A2XFK5_HIBSY|nr:Eukaryotic LigT isoform 1 [Hibiscus syriacus]
MEKEMASMESPDNSPPKCSSFAIRETATHQKKMASLDPSNSPPNHSFALRDHTTSQCLLRSLSTKEASFNGFHCSPTRYSTPSPHTSISNEIVYTGSDSNLISIWKLPEFLECGVMKTKASSVVALAVSHERVFAAYGDTKIRVWRRTWDDTLKHVKLATIPRTSGYVRSYISGKDKMFPSIKPRKFGEYQTSNPSRTSWHILNPSTHGILYTASDNATVRVWRRNFCREEFPHSLMVTLPAKCSPVKTLTLTADGRVLYGGCTDGYIHYSLKGWLSGQLQYGGALQGHTHAVMCLASVSNYVTSGSADSSCRVWTREHDGQHVCLAVLVGHRGPIRGVAAFWDIWGTRLKMVPPSAVGALMEF